MENNHQTRPPAPNTHRDLPRRNFSTASHLSPQRPTTPHQPMRRTFTGIIKTIKKWLVPTTRTTSRLPIPWRSLGLLFGTFVFLFALLFHFYFANTMRIVALLDEKRAAVDRLEESLLIVSSNLQFIKPLEAVPEEVLESLRNLEKSASSEGLRFPPQFITSYALRNVSGVDDQLPLIYQEGEITPADIRVLGALTRELLVMSSNLFEKDITTDTRDYIAYLRQSVDRIETLQESTAEFNLNTYLKIYRQMLASAEQYQINKDLNSFTFQTNSVASELYKTLSQSWDTVMQKTSQDISAKRSSLESIVNSYAN